jgi:hypothetical protein
MYLVQLCYASDASYALEPEDIKNIHATAQENNRDLGVTGALFFHNGHFLQCLEGSRACVNKIYHMIVNDKRHKNIVLLTYQDIHERQFNRWDMGLIDDKNLIEVLSIKYSGVKAFNPHHMSGLAANRLMVQLSETTLPLS